MSHEYPRHDHGEHSEIDDETRDQLFAARDLMNPIQTALATYHTASDESIKRKALATCITLTEQLRNEYDDLLTKIDMTIGPPGYILVMILINVTLEQVEPELALLS